MLRVLPPSVYLLLYGVFALGAPALAGQAVPSRPNILLLLADDLGYNDSGLYRDIYGQAPVSAMPNLEGLAKEGLRYTRFYTESTCSASRVALLTGQYPARQGFMPVGRGISPDVVTLPEFLQAQGYATHHVGKWHAGEINPEAFPARQGFDTSWGFLSQWMLQGPDATGNAHLRPPTYRDPWLVDEKGESRQYRGHLEDLLTEHTVKLLQKKSANPWFIYHAFLAPHTPLQPVEKFARQFPDSDSGKFLAQLAQLDSNLGKIFSALRASGQWDNTIVIFASDNGSTAKFADSNSPFSGGKAAYDEGGIRAPLVIKWHRAFRAAGIRKDPVSLMDIYPSLRIALEVEGDFPALDGQARLLPTADLSATPSPRYFLSYDGWSAFDKSFRHRLWQNWEGDRVTAQTLWRYDDRDLPQAYHQPFWQHWLGFSAVDHELVNDLERWRTEVRAVPVRIEQEASGYRSTGRDFQRAPINPAWAVAFTLMATEHGRQVLLRQGDFLEVVLEKNILRATVHGLSVQTGILADGRCHRVVLSGAFYDRYSNVREDLLPSELRLYVDHQLRDDDQRAIESLQEVDIAAPTFSLSRPHFLTTQYLPGDGRWLNCD